MDTQVQLNRLIGTLTSTKKLVELYEETDKQQMTPELAVVRGWILNALEERDERAFWAWIDSTIDSPREFFIKETK